MRALPTWARRRPVVLMYHGFTQDRRSDDPENLFVSVKALEDQMRWLLDSGWEPLTLQQWLEARAGLRTVASRSFLVTIDDALASVAEFAIPALSKLGIPCALFVSVGLVGDTAQWLPRPAHEPIMTRDDVIAADSPLVEIGLHGWDHTSMLACTPEELATQVQRGRDELSSWLGNAPRAFAYPFGDHDQAAREAVAEAGFEIAFSVFDHVGPMAISRVDVNATDTMNTFRFKLIPGYRRIWRWVNSMAALRRGSRAVLTRWPQIGT